VFKKSYWYKFIIPAVIFVVFFGVSCKSTGVVIDPNAAIIGSMDSLRQLRTINERSVAILVDTERFANGLIERLGSGAIDVRTALREYDLFVTSLIRRIEELEELSRSLDEEVLQGTYPFYNPYLLMHNLHNWKSVVLRLDEKENA